MGFTAAFLTCPLRSNPSESGSVLELLTSHGYATMMQINDICHPYIMMIFTSFPIESSLICVHSEEKLGKRDTYGNNISN